MKKILLLNILLFISGTLLFAQYPFEKYKALRKKTFNHWISSHDTTGSSKELLSSTISLTGVFLNKNKCVLRAEPIKRDNDTYASAAKLSILDGSKPLQVFSIDSIYFDYFAFSIVSVADFNGDSLPDIKITYPYMSNGLGLNFLVIYLLQEPDGTFTEISYTDMSGTDQTERDMDGDGKSIAISMSLVSHNGHSYWAYNLYKFVNDSLINVSQKFGYPILIQSLNKPNYHVAKNIPDSVRQCYIRPTNPSWFAGKGKIIIKK